MHYQEAKSSVVRNHSIDLCHFETASLEAVYLLVKLAISNMQLKYC